MLLLILLIVLAVIAFGGGHTYNGGAYRRHGFGCGGLLLLAILLFWLLGAFHG